MTVPDPLSIDLRAVAVTALSAILLFRFHQSVGRTLLVAALLGAAGMLF